MSDWLSLAASAAGAAKDAGFFKRWRAWLRRRRKVLVLGASGAGKTQFIHSLIDPLSPALDPKFRRTVAVEKRALVLDNYPFLLIDTPGQRLDEAKRKKAIVEAIQGRVEGVINLVAFGYHEAAESPSDLAVPEDGKRIARADYLTARREVELELLSEWVPFFDGSSVKWVLTVVSKADLWWPEAEKVVAHYQDGVYASTIHEPGVGHSVLPHCSVIEPFYGHKTSGKFGDHHRANLQSHLRETLIRLTGAVR